MTLTSVPPPHVQTRHVEESSMACSCSTYIDLGPRFIHLGFTQGQGQERFYIDGERVYRHGLLPWGLRHLVAWWLR